MRASDDRGTFAEIARLSGVDLPTVIERIRAMAREFDPDGMMNPGKLFT